MFFSRRIYSICLLLLMPLFLLRLLWRSKRLPAYRLRWAERFGYFPAVMQHQKSIWVHAVSVGEVRAAIPLITELLEAYPQHDIVITTTTPTGSAQVRQHFGDNNDASGNRVLHSYIPYDLMMVLKRFMRHIRPQMVVIMETEIWPNLFHLCGRLNIPVIMANARLSEKSLRAYLRFSLLTAETLSHVAMIAAQSDRDAQRFKKICPVQTKLSMTGNMKFDALITPAVVEQGQAMRILWGTDRATWVAASTHEGEEEQILQAHQQIIKEREDSLLVLVPRHPDRFKAVERLCQEQGFNVLCHSDLGKHGHADQMTRAQVYLVDTMGELQKFYAAVDVAFVGGSLVKRGGHNFLEPAMLAVPIITGPAIENFIDIYQLLDENRAILMIDDAQHLAQEVLILFKDAEKRLVRGRAAQQAVQGCQGATAKVLGIIGGLLASPVREENG